MTQDEMNEAAGARHSARTREILGDVMARSIELQAQVDVLTMQCSDLTKQAAIADEKLKAAEHQVEESGKEITRLTEELAATTEGRDAALQAAADKGARRKT